MTPENDPGGVFHWPYPTDQFLVKEGNNIKPKFGRFNDDFWLDKVFELRYVITNYTDIKVFLIH